MLRRNRIFHILLIWVLLDHLAYYMILPIVPIMLRVEEKLSLAQIGIVLGTVAFSFQFGSLIGGYLSDRIQRRVMIGIGALFRAIGLFGLGFFHSYWLFLLAAVISGTGGGMSIPSIKASIAASIPKDQITSAFSWRGIAANIGTGIAGLMVFFVLTESTRLIFFVAAAIYGLLSILSWIFLPHNTKTKRNPVTVRAAYKEIHGNRPFLWFCAVGVLIWALYSQINLVLPIQAVNVLQNPKDVSLIWSINSFIIILCQRWVTSAVIHKLRPFTTLAWGMSFISLGIASSYWSTGMVFLIASGIVFVMGEMLVVPTFDSLVSQLSHPEFLGLSFGFINLITGSGEGAGSFVGGKLQAIGGSVPWITYTVCGTICVLFLLRLQRMPSMKRALSSQQN